VKAYVAEQGAEAILCKHWAKGSAGHRGTGAQGRELAERARQFRAALPRRHAAVGEDRDHRAKRIYRADDVIADKSIRDQLKTWEAAGYGHLPVCMAKTQYSFSTDPNLRGAPTGHSVPVREVRLSAGAGLHRRDLRRDHDHAGPAQDAGDNVLCSWTASSAARRSASSSGSTQLYHSPARILSRSVRIQFLRVRGIEPGPSHACKTFDTVGSTFAVRWRCRYLLA
jgi:hypothetical protein